MLPVPTTRRLLFSPECRDPARATSCGYRRCRVTAASPGRRRGAASPAPAPSVPAALEFAGLELGGKLVHVIVRQGTRPHQAHLTRQNAPELWQFVETGAAQEETDDRKHARIALQLKDDASTGAGLRDGFRTTVPAGGLRPRASCAVSRPECGGRPNPRASGDRTPARGSKV